MGVAGVRWVSTGTGDGDGVSGDMAGAGAVSDSRWRRSLASAICDSSDGNPRKISCG